MEQQQSSGSDTVEYGI